MSKTIKITISLLLVLQFTLGVLGQGSPLQGLQTTGHQIVQLEDVKLEAISGFLVALLTMIALIPQGIMQAIEAKIHFDVQLLESLMGGGVGTNGSPQASMDFIAKTLHSLSGGGSASSGSSSGSSSGASSGSSGGSSWSSGLSSFLSGLRAIAGGQQSSSSSSSHSIQGSIQHSTSSGSSSSG